MKIDKKMIDPQLRFIGYAFDKLLGTNEKGFRRFNKISRMSNGMKIRGFDCREEYIQSRDAGRKIRVRVFRPKHSGKDMPGIIYLHGGGYAMGTPEAEIMTMGMFLKRRDCVVIAPDYRRSLDEPYPAALNDCYDTLEWMAKNHETLGFRKNQIFTAGCSAGGGLTIALNLMARDIGKIKIAYQMPLYPMIDDTSSTESMKDNDAPVWNANRNVLAWNLYLRGLDKNNIPCYAAPFRCPDFSGLPPACTFIGDADPFLDETKFYVDQLKKHKTDVKFKIYKGAYHSFETVNPRAGISMDAKSFLLKNFDEAADKYFT